MNAPSDPRVVTGREFREWVRPRLMLFLSADLAGSTKLKQSAQPAQWFHSIVDFVHEFPTEFQAFREIEARGAAESVPPAILPWKILGDELIFVIEIRHRHQPERELAAFAAAVQKWNSFIRGTKVKGAAWLAGFPVANTLLPVLSRHGLEADYIGPSVDAGFRLSKTATTRKLVLSADLVWWILKTAAESRTNSPRIHFSGCAAHKGLAEETGYPLLWLGVPESEFQAHEDKLLGREAADDPVTLRRLCEAFLREFGVPDKLPFLYDPENPGDVPPEFTEAREAAAALLRSVLIVQEEALSSTNENEEREAAELMRKIVAKSSGETPGSPPRP